MKKFLSMLLVCAMLFSVSTVPVKATDTITATVGGASITWSDADLEGSTALYNHRLAQASMALSQAAYYSASEAEKALKTLGFTVDYSYCYGNEDEDYDGAQILGYTVATKKLNSGKTVIAVVFQDAKTQEDWTYAYDFANVFDNYTWKSGPRNYSTTKIGPYHASAGEAYLTLAGYEGDDEVNLLETLQDSDNYCVWISGFGRGGSAANCLGDMLNKACGTEHVRSYAFGAPAVALASEIGTTSQWNNLFVINNPEDLLPMIPGWDFEHYGQLIYTRSFNDTANQASSDVQSDVSSLYTDYTGGDTYYTYEKGKTGAAKELAEYICGKNLAYDLEAYYTKEYTAYEAASTSVWDLMSPQKISITTFDLVCRVFGSVFGGGGIDSVATLAAGIYVKGDGASPYYDIVDFAMVYGLHVKELTEALNILGQDDITYYELLCASESKSYLAWMMATDSLEQLSVMGEKDSDYALDEFKSDSGYRKEETANGVTVSGEGVFFSDVTLNVSASDTTREKKTDEKLVLTTDYTVSLKVGGEEIDPYGPVTVSVPVPTGCDANDVTVLLNGKVQEVEVKDGKAYLTVRQLGTFSVQVTLETGMDLTVSGTNASYKAVNGSEESRTVILAAYHSNGQMLQTKLLTVAAGSIAADDWTVPANATVKMFMLSGSHAPVLSAVTK